MPAAEGRSTLQRPTSFPDSRHRLAEHCARGRLPPRVDARRYLSRKLQTRGVPSRPSGCATVAREFQPTFSRRQPDERPIGNPPARTKTNKRPRGRHFVAASSTGKCKAAEDATETGNKHWFHAFRCRCLLPDFPDKAAAWIRRGHRHSPKLCHATGRFSDRSRAASSRLEKSEKTFAKLCSRVSVGSRFLSSSAFAMSAS
jgi:hypothetical protein